MSKYWVVFKVALSERLVYRADFFISTFLRFIPIVTTILLWRAIYDGAGRATVGGLQYEQMVAYYLFIMISRAFGSMPRLSTDIARDIRDGGLRKYLLQPINYIAYLVTLRAAHKIVYFVMAAAPYTIVFYLCRRFLPAAPDAAMLALSIATLVLAFLLGFMINALIGMVGFWFLEVGSLVHVFMTTQYFLSGHMFPLSLLPESVQKPLMMLPFAYETYFPTMVLLQKLSHADIAGVLMMQGIWVVLLGCLIRFAWWRGLRRYAAFGG